MVDNSHLDVHLARLKKLKRLGLNVYSPVNHNTFSPVTNMNTQSEIKRTINCYLELPAPPDVEAEPVYYNPSQ